MVSLLQTGTFPSIRWITSRIIYVNDLNMMKFNCSPIMGQVKIRSIQKLAFTNKITIAKSYIVLKINLILLHLHYYQCLLHWKCIENTENVLIFYHFHVVGRTQKCFVVIFNYFTLRVCLITMQNKLTLSFYQAKSIYTYKLCVCVFHSTEILSILPIVFS